MARRSDGTPRASRNRRLFSATFSAESPTLKLVFMPYGSGLIPPLRVLIPHVSSGNLERMEDRTMKTFSSDGEVDLDGGTFAGVTRDSNRSIKLLNDLLRYRQPQAGSVSLRRKIGFKNL